MLSESKCYVHIFEFGRNTLRKINQYMEITPLDCIRNYCESKELILDKNALIYEGSPIFCDSNIIGYVSNGTLVLMRYISGDKGELFLEKNPNFLDSPLISYDIKSLSWNVTSQRGKTMSGIFSKNYVASFPAFSIFFQNLINTDSQYRLF